ncbi:trichohyalin-like [Lingula anatina]|uniref:Trichohyalin-like n=1 Tax=Lingula anatina TaxID=7574 RepID=A0A1S3HPJ5_LINAN|nr:trichohyalin-like [Lingula anatina]|eukprot:XP_013387962.1 trichohyalin-like [Lingula anatina]
MSGLRTSLITFTLGALVVVSTVTSIAHALPSPQSSSNVSTDCISLSQVQISTDYVERPGQGPAAYTGDNVTVTFNVSFGALDASVFDLEVVSLKIPHFTYSNNCASDINNITTCNVTFQSYVEVLNTEVQVVDGVDFLQANSTTITTTPKAVDFSWGSNFADYGNFSNTTLQFTVVLRVNESVTPATSYNFTAAVNTTCDALNYGMVSSSKSLFIGKVDVLINVFSNPQKVQAGDTAHFWMYVRPAESVLGNLTVNQIKVNLGQHTNFLAASLAAPTMTNLSISENVLTTTGFSIGVLGHGPSLDANVDVNVTVKDTVPLGGVAFGGAVTLLYQHGLTALSFFLALLLGAAIVFLIVVVYVKVAKNGIGNEVAPSTDNLRHGLITNANHAMKKGYKNIKDQSTVDEEESLVVIHCMGDPLQKNRALDSIDIASTITTDTEIEKQRYNSSQQALTMLIESLRKNGDISRQKEEAALKEFMRKVKEMEASMENQYKVAMEEVFRMISIKNKEQISIILKKQKEEKDKLERQMNTASDEEKAEVFEILRKEHDIQQQDAVHLLKLEQDEESEKLRKEFSIKKRAAVKDIQRQCLSQIVEQGELNQQQADWIINEHQKNQEKVDKIYDDEVSRQRAALEEKLTRRRMLASMADGEEDEYSEVLNTLAEQELQVVQKLEKQEIMDEDDAERYREEIAREMLAAKNRYDTERARQEAELKKRLREAKKQKLAEKAKFQQQELDELQKKQKEEQAQDNVDPIAVIEKQAIMTSKHRAEMTELENQIDLEQTRELLTLREKVTDETKEQLETNRQAFLDKLKNNGFMEDDQIKQILKQHNLQLNKLELAQQTDREKQQENLQRKLKEKKKELQQRREAEKLEQEQIREYEKNLTKKMLDNQVAVSDEERDRIMKEHEKQMVKLENSLTLNKLHQKRMLEKKLTEKRAKHMETLEKKQLKETKRVEKKLKTADEEEEEQHQAAIALMRKHAEQKLAVLQGDKLKLEEEMEQIREDMIKERAAALKAQEDQLGAMVAEMQLKKAEELSKIDQQQKAIFNLKSSLMEELNTQGVMSDPDTQRVLEKHQEQQEQLNKKLEQQKERQQRLLQEKLSEKMMQREKTMMMEHEDQLKSLLQTTSNKTAARFKAVSLKIKQAAELEAMKNDAVTEMNQKIESMKREFNMKHMQAVQQKELEFISGLVKVGQFNEKEVADMINWLFPMKDTEEKNKLLQMVYQGDDATKKNERPKTGLGERARLATLAHVTPESSRKTKSAKKSAKKREPSASARRNSGLDEEGGLPPVSAKGRRKGSAQRR